MNKHTDKELHPCKECDKKFGYWEIFFYEQTYWKGTSSLQIMWQEVWVLWNLFQWTNLLGRNLILAKNVTRSSSNIVSWTNSHWWETSSMQSMWQKGISCLQRMWQEVQIILSHEQTHTGEKPHPCKACDKKFGWSFIMNKHTGKELYPCKECDKKFK